MVRRHFLLPQDLINWLNSKSKETGFTVSEIVRSILYKEKASQQPKASASQSQRKEEE